MMMMMMTYIKSYLKLSAGGKVSKRMDNYENENMKKYNGHLQAKIEKYGKN